MDTVTFGELAAKVGRAIAEQAVIYEEPLRRMAFDEFVAVADLIAQKQLDQAKERIHAAMTADELAAEKKALAQVAVMMADKNARRRNIGCAIGDAVLKAALAAVLSAALF